MGSLVRPHNGSLSGRMAHPNLKKLEKTKGREVEDGEGRGRREGQE